MRITTVTIPLLLAGLAHSKPMPLEEAGKLESGPMNEGSLSVDRHTTKFRPATLDDQPHYSALEKDGSTPRTNERVMSDDGWTLKVFEGELIDAQNFQGEPKNEEEWRRNLEKMKRRHNGKPFDYSPVHAFTRFADKVYGPPQSILDSGKMGSDAENPVMPHQNQVFSYPAIFYKTGEGGENPTQLAVSYDGGYVVQIGENHAPEFYGRAIKLAGEFAKEEMKYRGISASDDFPIKAAFFFATGDDARAIIRLGENEAIKPIRRPLEKEADGWLLDVIAPKDNEAPKDKEAPKDDQDRFHRLWGHGREDFVARNEAWSKLMAVKQIAALKDAYEDYPGRLVVEVRKTWQGGSQEYKAGVSVALGTPDKEMLDIIKNDWTRK